VHTLRWFTAASLLSYALAAPGQDRTSTPPSAIGLKIVVVAGEDAVNVVQQKTAIAPVVEVRDRNDQPVAGAVVRFAIRGGRASFNGARVVSVTTNVAGRAAVSSLTPTGAGALQISASAVFQGQTAAVTIAQTNVLTAAEAATAAGAGGGGASGAGAAAGTAGGSGGGLSATTIGVIGGAAAGGTAVAIKAAGDGGSKSYAGPYSVQTNTLIQGGLLTVPCTNTHSVTGTVTLALDRHGDGSVAGTFTRTVNAVLTATTCPNTTVGNGGSTTVQAPVTGSESNIQASVQLSTPFDNGPAGSGAAISTEQFVGALANSVITGTWSLDYLSTTTAGANSGQTAHRSFSIPLTLQ
jgi:hypothetical protein